MKKTLMLLFFCICSAFLATGCEKKDINRLSIVSAVGIDKTDNGFAVTFQVVNDYVLSKINRIDIAPVSIRKIEGMTVLETMTKTSNYITDKYFLYHFRILAFGEDIAREGIQPFLNAFLNVDQTQHKYNIIVIEKGKAEDALKIHTTLDLIPGYAIEEKIRNSRDNFGLGLNFNLDQLLSLNVSPGSNFVLTSVRVDGDVEKGTKGDSSKSVNPEAYFVVSNFAVFKEDKLVGYFTEKESLGYQYIMNNIKKSIVTVVLDDESVLTIQVRKNSCSKKFVIENGKPLVKINCRVYGSVYEDMSGMTKFTSAYMDEVITKTEYEVTKMIRDSITRAQTEFNSDVFAFADDFHRYHPKFFRTIIDRYDEVFPEMAIDIKVKFHLERVR